MGLCRPRVPPTTATVLCESGMIPRPKLREVTEAAAGSQAATVPPPPSPDHPEVSQICQPPQWTKSKPIPGSQRGKKWLS